ncbi:bifunctional hydroxymethylpyrimidine kinase/phosphomethylpyrimidine kinase [Paracoccus methylarcula]|uniref:hydroxymethylpyrimidine kinase n=1 Tax=Paracoccus methylarcula TaxID=72022 RepID=A0A422QSH8_9RHOB|nr:bifunctional hydroxymethylpyrimidine kinase/phosphomethylpyrimidine kinase [Paracoccus methylarcula]RNF32970.1 bifunctional hydroxymethylpyrimidine kinase/phosphomethylpyrimidine kinase [Paracoccus methylarcula]
MIPNILSIAGSDPSGGAGIQADLKAISANGGYGMAAITALTAQNTRGVSAVHMVPPDFVAAQIGAVFDDIRVDAVKIGMLGDAAVIAAVARALEGRDCPVVLDPVMVAKGGDRLLAVEAVEALRGLLIPRATVITPNLPEAADLLGCAEARDRAGMEAQARALLELGPQAVLLKGGHLAGAESPDLLVDANRALWLEGRRHATRNGHGTGCSLSSALAARLPLSERLEDAVMEAKSYVYKALIASDRLLVGQGHGPLDHFWALR